jgi:hypothetical protein
MNRTNLYQLLIGAWLLGAGLMLGTVLPPPRAAWGEVTEVPPPAAFKSGGQLSVPVLQDISATLNQIDGRLARMEALFNKLATTPSRSANPNN